jgi:hypothetical protein
MSLYKNCGQWKHFGSIFEFSAKSYVRNTINLSCAKILFPSVIGVFVGFSRIFLLGILIFKGLTVRRLYKSFDVKGLILVLCLHLRMNGVIPPQTQYTVMACARTFCYSDILIMCQ